MMQGIRLPNVTWEEYSYRPDELKPGEYFKIGEHLWAVKAPNGDEGTIGKPHIVVEHDDGTISVMPSLQFQHGGRWHGYLDHGVWREA